MQPHNYCQHRRSQASMVDMLSCCCRETHKWQCCSQKENDGDPEEKKRIQMCKQLNISNCQLDMNTHTSYIQYKQQRHSPSIGTKRKLDNATIRSALKEQSQDQQRETLFCAKETKNGVKEDCNT